MKLLSRYLKTILFITAATLLLTADTATAQDTEPSNDIYGEAAYEQFVETCRDQVDQNNFWVFSSEEKRSICSDELIVTNSTWSNFLNSNSYGDYPIHNYQIVSDDGKFWNALRQIKDFLTGFIFSLVLLITALTILLLEFAYEFKIIGWLAETFGDLSNQYVTNIGYGTNQSLYALALFATTFVAGMHALRGRMAKAGSEMLGAYIAAFTLALIVAFGGFLTPIISLINTTLDISDELSGVVLEPHQQCEPDTSQDTQFATFFEQNPVARKLIERGKLNPNPSSSGSDDDDSVDAVTSRDHSTSVCTAAVTLQESFVAEPYDYIQWGDNLDQKAYANCAVARDIILSKQWTSNDPEPRFLMRHAGDECKQFAEFNHDPTMERMSMTLISLLVSLIGLTIVFWALIQLLVAQLKLMFTIATGSWAFISAMGPSKLRGGFYGWLNAVTKSLLDLIAISLFLAFYLSVYSTISKTDNIDWSAKSILLTLTSIAFFIAKRKTKTKSKELADTATNTLAKTRPVEPETSRIIDQIHNETTRQTAKIPTKIVTRAARQPKRIKAKHDQRKNRKKVGTTP